MSSPTAATTPDTALRDDADAFVATLLARYRERFVWEAPVSLEGLAACADAKIFVGARLPGVKGRLVPTANGYSVWVSDEVRDGRSFTIAHELAHIFFYDRVRGGVPHRRDDLRVPAALEERLCDYIAANLLMPRPLIEAALGAAPDVGVMDVLAVHRTFAVSVRAAARRVVRDFRPLPGVLFTKWRFHQHPQMGDVLALDWAEGPGEDQSPGTIAPAASVVYQALGGRELVEGLDAANAHGGALRWTQALAWMEPERPTVFALHRDVTFTASSTVD